MTPAAATRIPVRHLRTPAPTASTTPAQSTPRISGSTGPRAAFVAGAHAHVEHAIDGRGMDPDADFALAGRGIGHVLVLQHVRRAILMDHDRFHASLSEGVGIWCEAGMLVGRSQSILMPASRTMRSHLAASAFTRAANSGAVIAAGSMKLASSRFLASASWASSRT